MWAGIGRFVVFAVASTATLACVVDGAAAQDGARQRIAFTFDSRDPGTATGLQLTIDYVNPADPAAKPYAVQTLVERLAAGARFDTSVPARCPAPDYDLMTRGATACPPGSRVGAGELDLDTGLEGPARIVRNAVTLLSNQDELILLVEQEGGSRVVARSKIDDGALYAAFPPLPGGPPDGYTAIKRVHLKVERIVAGGRAYVTTPPTCPPAGEWVNTIAFAYRDGATQMSASPSPCAPPPRAGTPPDSARPRIRVHGVPRRCTARTFVARASIIDASPLARAVARLDGRRLRATKAKHFRIRIEARRLRPGRHRVSVVASDRAGNRASRTVAFRRCGRRAPR